MPTISRMVAIRRAETQHKQLTEYERSKHFMYRAEQERGKLKSVASGKTPETVSDGKRHAKDKPVKESDVADAVGVSAAWHRAETGP